MKSKKLRYAATLGLAVLLALGSFAIANSQEDSENARQAYQADQDSGNVRHIEEPLDQEAVDTSVSESDAANILAKAGYKIQNPHFDLERNQRTEKTYWELDGRPYAVVAKVDAYSGEILFLSPDEDEVAKTDGEKINLNNAAAIAKKKVEELVEFPAGAGNPVVEFMEPSEGPPTLAKFEPYYQIKWRHKIRGIDLPPIN